MRKPVNENVKSETRNQKEILFSDDINQNLTFVIE